MGNICLMWLGALLLGLRNVRWIEYDMYERVNTCDRRVFVVLPSLAVLH